MAASSAQKLADVSSSSDEGSSSRVPSAGRKTGHSSAKPPIVPAKEQELTDLLQRASMTIQQEREKVRRLVEENDALRSEIQRLRTSGKPGGQQVKSDPPSLFLKQRLHEIALENHLAVEQICALKMKVSSLEAQLQRRCTSQTSRGTTRSKSAQPPQREPVAVVVTPSKHSYAAHQTTYAKGSLMATPRHQEETVSSRHKHQSSSPVAAGTQLLSTSGSHYVDPVPCANIPQPTVAITLSPQRPPPHPQQHVGATATKDYNDMMLNRLRRAMAPQPTRDQIGEVVHAMVHELQRQLLAHSRGAAKLQLKKLGSCVYFSDVAKKKLHLTVDSGRLVVKSGGGHVDFLEYIERNKLCTAAP